MSLVNLVILVAMVLVLLLLRIVKEYDRGVIFFLGEVTGVRGPGLIILSSSQHLSVARQFYSLAA
jgi:regulator of protease activity HflC (stomatin/prohibitin superfamily)